MSVNHDEIGRVLHRIDQQDAECSEYETCMYREQYQAMADALLAEFQIVPIAQQGSAAAMSLTGREAEVTDIKSVNPVETDASNTHSAAEQDQK